MIALSACPACVAGKISITEKLARYPNVFGAYMKSENSQVSNTKFTLIQLVDDRAKPKKSTRNTDTTENNTSVQKSLLLKRK